MPYKRTGPYFERLVAHVGSQVKAHRIRQGMTQGEVARGAKVTDKFVSHVETKGENLSLHSVGALAQALHIQPGDLLPRGKEPLESSKPAIEAKALIDIIDRRPKGKYSLRLIVKILEAFAQHG